MNDQFKRILELIRRTGDRMVVTDPNGKDTYVVMDLDDYETLLEAVGVLDDAEFMEEPPFMDEDRPPELMIDENPGLEEVAEIDPMLREAFPAEASAKISEELTESENSDDEDDPEEHFYLEPVE